MTSSGSIWQTLDAAGVDITRTEQMETYDRGPEYKISNPDGTWVAFGAEYEDGELLGWTYCAYDEEGGVMANDGAPTLDEILPELVRGGRE